ncbi:MAG TPA: PKD domain-containing protein [Streptosporangiaceae bacterium]
MSATAATTSATSHGPTHPAAYVPLRGAKGTGFDRVFTNMDYNGGPVMPSNTDYMVLWSPSGLSAYPAGYVSGLKTFFTDLAHDSGGHQNVDSVTAQYNDSTGAFARYQTTFGGALVDTDPYPTSQCPANAPVTECLTDAQIQAELQHFVVASGLKTDLSHEYFLLTPPHVESCFSNDPTQSFGGCSAGEPRILAAYCAYHENTTTSPMLLYAEDPFDATNRLCQDGNNPTGSIAGGEINGGLSHEQNESVSDPIPNDAWTNGAGANQGEEVGDQCVGEFGTPLGKAPNGAKYNQVINGHFYWFQEEWSNQTHSCLQRLTPSPARPHAMFKVTAGSGLTLNFDASGSTAPGGVAEYVWQFNDAFAAQTIEQTTPKISHTFPSAGAYSVGLTIMSKNGTSTGNGGIVTTGQSGITTGFILGPTHPSAGQQVSFSALSSVSAQPVMVYLWEFGDGTTGSGQTPTHVYSRPGQYTVTLVMFSGVGSAFPGQGAGPVSTRTLTVTG